MAAVLKKRALAEYTQTVVQEPQKPPLKRLKLVKKQQTQPTGSVLALVTYLENCKNSNEALNTLLRISDNLTIDAQDLPEVMKRLSEHFRNEVESVVRVKILSLLCEIGQELAVDVLVIIDEIISLLKNDHSHKVIAQGMNTILKLGKLVTDSSTAVHHRLVEIAKFYLKDVNHTVKCKCLEIIGTHSPICEGKEAEAILFLVSSYFKNEDARVRSQAFSTIITLHERGFQLNPDIYSDVCDCLKDDYEIVRSVVLKLVWVLAQTYPDHEMFVTGSDHEIRLIDDAFGKICSGVTDLSMQVRTLSAKLLGSMTAVSPKFLNQTLDKKLMSNMRRKRTAHELAWENVTSGEWASGKKWADDAPKEVLDAESINLINSGACGAFVHGLEDEYLEVRSAAVESLCQLSLNNSHFANLSLDFLVDMFNDEIEDVRLKAIDSLRLISEHIVLRDDQVETILGALEDFSQEVREGLHRMLASCRMLTTCGLKMCVEKLLDNLKKYPNDKRSTYRCLQKIGAQHAELVLPLVPQFLNIHPFFDIPEPDVENPQYICMLILIFNAAKNLPTITPLLESHTKRHYQYLRDTMTSFVPVLNFTDTVGNTVAEPISVEASLEFLNNVINNLDITEATYSVHCSLLQTAKDHLNRLSKIDPAVAGTAQFTALFIGAQLIYSQIMENGYWANPTSSATHQSHNLITSIQNLLEHCLKLQFFFVGLSPADRCAVKQMHMKALALNLVYIVKGSNSSALAPCHHFLTVVENLQCELDNYGLEPESFTVAVFKELSNLEEPKPGMVSRILIPIISESRIGRIPRPNVKIRMSSAEILEPTGQTDTSLKFTAGLIMSVPFEAELHHLLDPSRIRIKVKYPDQRTQVILPRPAHMKPLETDTEDLRSDSQNIRLLTDLLISHQVWSEACNIDINVALAIPEADIGRRRNVDNTQTLLDLCKPVKISVAPKPIKKNILG
ncbi:integrator complex subunit 4 [Coccinella septempunctata]|uniref:integrator complex subunit 4 n=1 Tax=Coccinella septempunctata TaxID=41139 RepID=UPI001D072C48|nr:integrator complex subunit 4 [Coccinella septempunctata]